MDFLELARERYSCKKYAPTPVEKEKLDAILEAARIAPTAKNSQPQRVYVLQSEEALSKADGLTPCRYGAPVMLLIAYDRDLVFHYPGGVYDSGAEDMGIVATHAMLAAAAEGVDSCWVNFFDPDKAAKAFGLPENEVPVLFLDLGYAAPEAGPLDNHIKRKPLEETTTWL